MLYLPLKEARGFSPTTPFYWLTAALPDAVSLSIRLLAYAANAPISLARSGSPPMARLMTCAFGSLPTSLQASAAPGAPSGASPWRAIDVRRAALETPRIDSNYGHQKDRDLADLDRFLQTVPAERAYSSPFPVTVATCVGRHIVDYLIARSFRPSARTVVHSRECPGLPGCACPLTMAWSTVDSTIGKLRAAFHNIGRQATVPLTSAHLFNPCADYCVRVYLQDVMHEQARAGITPRRAVPLLSDKLSIMYADMQRVIADPSLSPAQLFTTLSSRALLALGISSLKRNSELVSTRTFNIISFPGGEGLIFNYTWGKTLRDGSVHTFGIRRDDDRPDLCPVAHITAYFDGALALGVDLSHPGPGAPLFRRWLDSPAATTESLDPMPASDLTPMLRMWLQRSGIDGGETFRSLRAGGAIEMALSGAPLAAIMAQGYWVTPAMARHYMGFDRTVAGGGPVPPPRAQGGTAAPLRPGNPVLADWRHANELDGFYRAFSSLPLGPDPTAEPQAGPDVDSADEDNTR